MDAVVFAGRNSVEVRRIPRAEIEAPGDAVVRVDLAAICGSDLHPYNCREPCDVGTVFGHEFVGTVEELGADAALSSGPAGGPAAATHDLAVGQRVFSPFSTACGSCDACAVGLSARCSAAQLFGWRLDGRGLHGGQAQFVRVPLARSTLLPLPAGLDPEDALLLGDIFTTAVFAAVNAGVLEGGSWGGGGPAELQLETFFRAWDAQDGLAAAPASGAPAGAPREVYVVVGCGPVGVLAAAVLSHALRMRHALEHALGGVAASHAALPLVLAVDSVPSRLVAARAAGAVAVALPPPSADASSEAAAAGAVREALAAATATSEVADGAPARPPRVVATLECVGAPSALRLAFDTLSPGGVLSSVGVNTTPHFPFSPGEAYDKNLALRCGRCPARSLLPWSARILASMRASGVDVRDLVISHRLPLSDAPRAYVAFNAREDGWEKVVLRPW